MNAKPRRPRQRQPIRLAYGDGSLELRVEPALAQAAVTLRTYSRGRATNIAHTVKAEDAQRLAALILEAAKASVTSALFAPAEEARPLPALVAHPLSD